MIQCNKNKDQMFVPLTEVLGRRGFFAPVLTNCEVILQALTQNLRTWELLFSYKKLFPWRHSCLSMKTMGFPILSIPPHTQPSQPQQDCSSCLGHRTQTSITDIKTTPLLHEPPQTTSVSKHSLQQPKHGTQHLHSTFSGFFQGCCLAETQLGRLVSWNSPEYQHFKLAMRILTTQALFNWLGKTKIKLYTTETL